MMKYSVQVDGKRYVVEIQDVNARPVIALVDGEPVEVWPETDILPVLKGDALHSPRPHSQPATLAAREGSREQSKARNAAGQGAPSPAGNGVLKTVRAPIPGVIIALAVEPEAEVKVGQELCVLEAMKMKNSIRATRSGRIGSVKVALGQHVKHQELLMEYAE